MYRNDKEKTPLFGGRMEENLSKLISKSILSIKGDLKKMRREMESSQEFGSRAKSRFAHDRCENVATLYYAQRSQMPRSTKRKLKEEEMPRRETLSNFLQEYESQTEKFRDNITFKGFCKIKVERRKLHDMDRFSLSTFDGSPTCYSSTKFLKMKPSELQNCTLKVRPMLGGCLSHFH